MIKPFNGTETLGEIVAAFPGASNLFKAKRIDFCCGGDRQLDAVLQEKGMDSASFLGELNALVEQAGQRSAADIDWREAPLGELVDHIVRKHHAYLEQELPVLGGFVTKILRVHGFSHPELVELHKLFHQAKVELEQHMIDEETNVFPLIKQAEQMSDPAARKQALGLIGELEHEHELVGGLLQQMREITSDYVLPEGACTTYALTFRKLEELESDTFEHVHLENNILFSRLGA